MKIHIAEDHDLYVEGVKAVLKNTDIEITGISRNGLEVIKWREKNNADLLLLDIDMPYYNGVEVLRHFKKKKLKQKTLIISQYCDYFMIEELLKLGSNGYYVKGSKSSLLEAINSVRNGEIYLSEEVSEKISHRKEKRLEEEKSRKIILLEDLIKNEDYNLSNQQKEIFVLLVMGHQPRDIRKELNLHRNTIQTQIHRIKDKFLFESIEELVKFASSAL